MDMNVIDSIFNHTILKLLSNHIFGVKMLNICLLGCFTSRSTAMVMSRHLTFSWVSLTKWITSTSCKYFRLYAKK